MENRMTMLALASGMALANAQVAAAKDAPSSGDSATQQAAAVAAAAGDKGKAPSYTPFADLTGVQKLNAAGVRYTVTTPPAGPLGFTFTALEPYKSGVKASYDPATGDITYTAPDGFTATFTSADEVPGQSTPAARVFFKPIATGGVIVGSLTTPSISGVALSYTRFGTLVNQPTGVPLDGHAFTFGVPTQASDLPRSGSAAYTSAVGGSAFVAGSPVSLRLTGSTATFSADFGAGTIATALNLVGTPLSGGTRIFLDSVTGTGSISGPKPGFTGTLTGTGSVSGNFAGMFYGPNAVEFGYDYLVSGTSGAGLSFSAVGGVFGSTAIAPPPPPVYTPFASLTGVQNFASAGINYTVLVPLGGSTPNFSTKALETLGTGVAVQYDTASGNITFTAPNGLNATFTAADVNAGASTPTSRVFTRLVSGGVLGGSLTTPTISGVPLSYTRIATFFAQGAPAAPSGFDGHAFVFGVQTQASDVPLNGTATYTGGAGGSAFIGGSVTAVRLTGAPASLTANFGSGTITTALTLAYTPSGGSLTTLDVLTGTGSLGATLPGFSGTLAGTGSVTGNFVGAFYGPQAAEFGYDFLVGGTNGAGTAYSALGSAIGKQP